MGRGEGIRDDGRGAVRLAKILVLARGPRRRLRPDRRRPAFLPPQLLSAKSEAERSANELSRVRRRPALQYKRVLEYLYRYGIR